MKKPHLFVFTLLCLSFVFLFNGCAPSGGSNSSSPDYEGTWVAHVKKADISGLYIKNTFSLSGTKYNDETLTYSWMLDVPKDLADSDFRANGTFTTGTGGVVDGKQLIKINYVATIKDRRAILCFLSSWIHLQLIL